MNNRQKKKQNKLDVSKEINKSTNRPTNVFRMNQYDFVAATTQTAAVEWYESSGGVVDNKVLCEVDIHTMGMPYGDEQEIVSFEHVLKSDDKSNTYLIYQIN